jgi:4-amino-4-deoxy-L-arabinose transferase-like glycosyltransferase
MGTNDTRRGAGHESPAAHGRGRRRALVPALLGLLLLAAGAQRAWNAYSVPPLLGYDAPGHAAYVLGIREDGRLPHPYDGWSTFHPPLYYLLGSAAWSLVEPWGPQGVTAALRGIGAVAGLAAALVAFTIVRRLGAGSAVALVATSLVLFVPCAQMSAAMVGNEAFAAGIAALALPPVLVLQEDPRNLRAALLAGLGAGLALASKVTGIYVLAACLVPFFRPDLDRRVVRTALALVAVAGLLAGPVYVRNLAVSGELVPMTRDRNPMRNAEASMILRPRQLADYFVFPAAAVVRPYVRGWELLEPAPWLFKKANEPLTSVWGLAYASLWNDAFGHRLPHASVTRAGPILGALGIVPTALALLGFLAATVDAVRTWGRSRDAPLVAMTLLGLAAFVSFTWQAPSIAAAKGSYLLPLAVPAAVFFARGATMTRGALGVTVLIVSVAASVAAAIAFTDRLVFASMPMTAEGVRTWARFAAELPRSHLDEVVRYFFGIP